MYSPREKCPLYIHIKNILEFFRSQNVSTVTKKLQQNVNTKLSKSTGEKETYKESFMAHNSHSE